MFMMAASLALCGFLLIPSAGYALWRLLVPSAPPRLPSLRSIHLVVIILLLPAILWLGEKVVSTSSLAWLLLPFFHLAAVGLPVLVVLYLAVHGLPLGSPQRQWGVFWQRAGAGPLPDPVCRILSHALIHSGRDGLYRQPARAHGTG